MKELDNSLFIGADSLTMSGRDIKHHALIRHFAQVNVNKHIDEMPPFIGLDLETNHKTAELKLLGFYDHENNYRYHTENFLQVLYLYVRKAIDLKANIVWWNRLDPLVLFKQFLLVYNKEPKVIDRAMEHYSKIAGDYDRKNESWNVKPIISVQIGNVEFGIMNVIRSSVLFYIKRGSRIQQTWGFDVAQMYMSGLEKEAKSRFDYYSKVDESAHLVNWNRFKKDKDYRENVVLKSNELDARAVRDLAIETCKDFYGAFKVYPKTLVSQGSLARTALIATLERLLKDDYDVYISAKRIGLVSHLDSIFSQLGQDKAKDFLSLVTESYSAGYIESVRFGSADKGAYADIASAYPAIIVNLYDLTGAKYEHGTGTPKRAKKGYTFIRGYVDIPENIDFNPITVKHPIHTSTNIRATGYYRASYTIDERDFMESQGVKFEHESWVKIETQGKLSPLAVVAREFIELRTKLMKQGNSAQYMAKIASNSLYGILFEAVHTYLESNDHVTKAGYRAGEFYNPIYASIITARTRTLLARASLEIEKNGGKVIALMTDSITWAGEPSQLPQKFWREKKTLGYFEKPENISDIICLGAGRYGFDSNNGYMVVKQRGLNIGNLSWHELIENAGVYDKQTKQIDYNRAETDSRVLITVGTVLGNHEYDYKDLGLVKESKRVVDLVVGLSKRPLKEPLKVNELKSRLFETESINLPRGMFGDNDLTLPKLRTSMNKLTHTLHAEKVKAWQDKANKNYYENHRTAILEAQKGKDTREYKKAYYERNKDRIRAKQRERYARKKAERGKNA